MSCDAIYLGNGITARMYRDRLELEDFYLVSNAGAPAHLNMDRRQLDLFTDWLKAVDWCRKGEPNGASSVPQTR